MPIETEIKLRVDSHGPIRERLIELGASRVALVIEDNRILDDSVHLLRKRGCGLRFRTRRSPTDGTRTATLTFKGPVAAGPLKSREEIEVEIGDPVAANELFARLGFATILRYEKRRESWRMGACQVELDEPPRIGLFVEIEGPTEQVIRESQEALELESAPVEYKSYVQMLAEYCDLHGISPRVVMLDS